MERRWRRRPWGSPPARGGRGTRPGGQKKTDVTNVMIHGPKFMQNAKEIVGHLNSDPQHSLPKLSSYKSVNDKRSVDEHLHLHLSPEEVAAVPKRDGKTLEGIKSIDEYRMVKGHGMEIMHRRRSCRCTSCQEKDYDACACKDHVPNWVPHTLEAKDTRTEYHTRSRHEENLEIMTMTAKAGSICAIEHTDREYQDYDYFLLLLTANAFMVREH